MIKATLQKIWPYLVIAGLCVGVYLSNRRAATFWQKASTLETTISDMNQKLKLSQIQLNDSVLVYQAEVKALNVTKDNLQSKYDQLLRASDLKAKDVSSVTEVVSVIHDVDTVVADVDSFGGITAQYCDPFINIGVSINSNLNTIIDYEVHDSLTIVNVQKKHSWLFGLIKWKEAKSVRVINHNPKATISSMQTIDVIE